MNLATQVERWKGLWFKETNPSAITRHLERLHWLEEFTFHCGAEITPQYFQALQEQIENGNSRLAELQSEFECRVDLTSAPAAQLDWATR
jgi:hypothetical protein